MFLHYLNVSPKPCKPEKLLWTFVMIFRRILDIKLVKKSKAEGVMQPEQMLWFYSGPNEADAFVQAHYKL